MKHWLRLIRPKQWTKNAFVLSPLFFSFAFLQPHTWGPSLLAVLCFILLSSTTYIINDIRDVKEDKKHPRKKLRPIASGKISVQNAIVGAAILFSIALWLMVFVLPISCAYVGAAYIVLQTAYNLHLKHQAIMDVLCIACGFVLRVLMGGFAIDVPISPWIILSTMVLATFLGFGKRYQEMSVHGYATSRKSLQRYSVPLLDRLIGVSCALTLMSYALYAVEISRTLDSSGLVYTTLFVMFGVFRYLQVVYVDHAGGEPEHVLLRDKIFIANGICWLVVTLLLLSAPHYV